MRHLRNQGKRISGVIPFGYSLAPDGSTLIPNHPEQKGIQLILELKFAGLGCRRIAATLIAEHIPTKTGTKWSPQAVHNILKREMNTKRTCYPV